MVKRPIQFFVACTLLLSACRSASVTDTSPTVAAQNDLMNAVVWIQTSAEADALRRQAFVVAQAALDAALADSSWTAADEQTGDYGSLPPAVIVDVDETVLDNSPLEARLIRLNESYSPKSWRAWVEERRAKPLPGALEFAAYATAKGVTVFYVTNRNAEEEAATRDNLERAGFPLDSSRDVVLTRGEAGSGSDKTGRRAVVASTHRILLLIGDDLGDFTSREGSVSDRRGNVEANANRWGSRWIVLPNPMYGSWDRALPVGPSGDDAHAKKLDALVERRE